MCVPRATYLDMGEAMFSGAGDALAEERLEDDGEGYGRREPSACDRSESSESESSVRSEAIEGEEEGGTELSGELGSCAVQLMVSVERATQ